MTFLSSDEVLARLAALMPQGQRLIFHKGQVLFYAGHNPYGIFIVQTGRVRFKDRREDCAHEHIHNSSQGSVIGLGTLVSGDSACCTAVAEDECRVVFISKTLLANLS